MELKAGYKRTEAGVIPGDWEVHCLGEEIERLEAGVSVNSVDEAIRVYGHEQSIIKTSAVLNGLFLPHESKKIAPKDVKRARLNPRADSIIISRMNTPDLVGECGYVGCDYPNLFIPDRLWMTFFKKDSKLNVKWLNYLLNHKKFKLKIKGSATGTSGSMKNISKNSLLSIAIPFPPLPEQNAIAAALSDVDTLIAAQDKLINKKRSIKTATMQRLLTGKKRLPGFNGDWKIKPLGDVASFHKGKGLAKSELDPFGSEPCIHYGELFTQHPETISKILSHTNIATDVFRSVANDVLMPTSDVTPNGLAKASCVLQSGVVLGGDILVIRTDPKELSGSYLSYIIRQSRDRVMQLVTGTTVFHLYGSDMKRFEFLMPGLEEQQAIVKVLSEMAAEITALEFQRDKTKAIKEGIMQELLTGRTRLI